jgi:hypothetical protein
MNHRQQIIDRLLQNEKSVSGKLILLLSMLEENKQSIVARPGSETLWYHSRGLMTSLLLLYKTLPLISDDTNVDIETKLSLLVKGDEIAGTHPIQQLLDTVDSPNQVSALACYTDIMLAESQFTNNCVYNESLWNDKQQKLYAWRYQLHMLQHAIRCMPSDLLLLRGVCEKCSRNIAQELIKVDIFSRVWKVKML